jgi:hypothetical protein
MKPCTQQKPFFPIFIAIVMAMAISLAVPHSSLAGPKSPMSTPTITCNAASTNSIDILFTAGSPTGAPAGFSLQWETFADFSAFGGWPSDAGDCLPDLNGNPTCPSSFCKGSFSGAANLSNYKLSAGQSVSVRVGDLLFDNGASTDCPEALECGTEYIFRAFSHANNTYNRSSFTPDLVCSTGPCNPNGGCTLTQGYWKTHNPVVCETDSLSPLCIQWPVTSLTLGNNSYTVAQLVSILNQPVGGNGLISLAHQLIAAKLNIANGADGSAVASTITSADQLIGNLWIPPVQYGSLNPSATSSLVNALNNYNTGATGPGHCDDKDPSDDVTS